MFKISIIYNFKKFESYAVFQNLNKVIILFIMLSLMNHIAYAVSIIIPNDSFL
jgi:hypothetical protein